jgi:hypothetical protein
MMIRHTPLGNTFAASQQHVDPTEKTKSRPIASRYRRCMCRMPV